MKIILTQRVANLGNVGEIVNVSEGYARNFLIPGNLASLVHEGNEKMLRGHQKKLAFKIEEEKNKALELQKKLVGMILEFQKKITSGGKLFGAVTSLEISKELGKRDIQVERRLIRLERPIKSLGVFKVSANLFSSVAASFQVKVIQDLKQVAQTKKAVKKATAKKTKKRAAAEKVVSTKAESESIPKKKEIKSKEVTDKAKAKPKKS